MTIDILPTIAGLVGASLPDHPIDGKDIWPLLAGEPEAKSPQKAYYFYWGRHLQGIRRGKWKLHFPHQYRLLEGEPGKDGMPGPYTQAETGLALYDLENDVGEQVNVADQYPEVVARLTALAEQARDDLGDSATGQVGRGVREPGRAG